MHLKTLATGDDRLSVELSEFELTALAALVERGQHGLEATPGDESCIRSVIVGVAEEFKGLLDHF